MSNIPTSLGQLIKLDLEQAYILPVFPSSCSSYINSKFINKDRYCLFDHLPSSSTNRDIVFPQALSCTAGNEIPILTDHPPPDVLKQHWKKWLPAFPLPISVSCDEGLKEDGVPIVTAGAFQDIPRSKHSVDPDILQLVQLKSSIPEIGVPHPRYMDEDNVEFPCVIKPDLSFGGRGVFTANNKEELTAYVKNTREKHGWSGKIIYQEMIQDIKGTASYLFYLTKSCKVVWLGSNQPILDGFEYIGLACDWNKQEQERRLVDDQFVIPIAQFLHRKGYFGPVNFDTIEDDRGTYLVDLNPRFPGEISHHLIAPFMATMGLTISELRERSQGKFLCVKKLVDVADQLNQTQNGRVIIQSAGFGDKENDCPYMISIFANTRESCQKLWKMLTMN